MRSSPDRIQGFRSVVSGNGRNRKRNGVVRPAMITNHRRKDRDRSGKRSVPPGRGWPRMAAAVAAALLLLGCGSSTRWATQTSDRHAPSDSAATDSAATDQPKGSDVVTSTLRSAHLSVSVVRPKDTKVSSVGVNRGGQRRMPGRSGRALRP